VHFAVFDQNTHNNQQNSHQHQLLPIKARMLYYWCSSEIIYIYISTLDELLFVVDSSDRERLKEGRDQLFGIITNEKTSSILVAILANKSDLSAAVKSSELIEQFTFYLTTAMVYSINLCYYW
jgi:hypothetical protein